MLNTLRTFFLTKVNPPVEGSLPEPYLVGGSWIHLSIQPLLPFWSNLRERVGEDTVNRDQHFNILEMLKLGKRVGGKVEKSSTMVEMFLKTTDCKPTEILRIGRI